MQLKKSQDHRDLEEVRNKVLYLSASFNDKNIDHQITIEESNNLKAELLATLESMQDL